MIRRRLQSTSPEPRRRRLAGIPAPSILSDERDLSDDDLAAALRLSYLAEQARIRDAILRESGGDIMRIVQEGLRNMSIRRRRRILSLLDHRLGMPLEKTQKELGIE